MREILIGVLPVLGVVVGSILTHVLAKSKDRQSQISALRQQTYADYLRAVSAVATSRSPITIGQLVDAKARMAIYASDDVIKQLSEFEAAGAVLSDPAAKASFVRLANQMRSENGSSETKQGALMVVLFGNSQERSL